MENSFYINEPENNLLKEKRKVRSVAMFVGVALIITWIITQVWSIFYFAIMKQFGFNSTEATALFYDPMVSRLVNTVISVISFTLPFLIIPSGSGISVGEAVRLTKPEKGSFLPSLLIGAGFCGFSNIASNLLLTLLSGLGMSIPDAGMSPAISKDPFGMGVAFISTVVVAPLVEEFAFRGAVLGSLRKYGDGLAIIVSAVMFGLVHGNIRQIPFAFLSGVVLGFITVKSGSLWMGILAHAVNNGIAFASSILAGILPAGAVTIFNAALLLLLTAGLFITVMVLGNRSKDFFKLQKSTTETPQSGLGIIFFTSPFIIVYVILVVIRVVSTF